MIELTFSTELHASVVGMFATGGFPAILRIGRNIELLFSVAAMGDYTALIDERHREVISSHPIMLAGGDYMARSLVMVTMSHAGDKTHVIRRLDYFDARTGWAPMIVEGTPIVIQPEPEPNWLPTRHRKR